MTFVNTQPKCGWKSGLITALMVSASLLAFSTGAHAQQNNSELATQYDEKIDITKLESGRLESIDWRNLKLVIDGREESFNDDILRVYHNDNEVTLIDLQPNTIIRYQRSGNNGVVVRIWTTGQGSIVDS